MPQAKSANEGRKAEPGRPTPHAFWTGTITFGLISVPVQLFPAIRRRAVSLRMLDQDGTPLRRRYFCPLHERAVEPDEIVRGFEVEPDQYVVVSDEELETVEPKKSREIDLKVFVPRSDIPPLFFQRSYFLTPTGDSNKAYRLLAEAMERSQRAGIASFVMRNKEYLVAILAEDGILCAETLRFQEELRNPDEMGLTAAEKVGEAEVRRLEASIARSSRDALDPGELRDDYSEDLRRLASRKHEAGRDVIEVEEGDARPDPTPEPSEDFEEVDLLETIRLRLEGEDGSTGNGSGNGSGHSPEDESLDKLPKTRLYERAKALDVPGRSTMGRKDLINALRRRRRPSSTS